MHPNALNSNDIGRRVGARTDTERERTETDISKTMGEQNMERLINKITAYFWLALAIVGAVGVLFFGAWWHLPTTALCVALYRLFLADSKTE